MTYNQTFFCDLYGYKDYNGEELTENFLNNGDYIDTDNELETSKNKWGKYGYLKENIEQREKDGQIITEIFLKLRILRNDPIFKHIMNGGTVKIIPLDPNQNNND